MGHRDNLHFCLFLHNSGSRERNNRMVVCKCGPERVSPLKGHLKKTPPQKVLEAHLYFANPAMNRVGSYKARHAGMWTNSYEQ